MTEQGPARPPPRRPSPEATVARLPVYLRALHALAESGGTTVSSEALAAAGRRRQRQGAQGPVAPRLATAPAASATRSRSCVLHISRELGLTQGWSVVLVGVGNLGHALAGYGGFASRGFRVAALLDADPRRVGRGRRPASGCAPSTTSPPSSRETGVRSASSPPRPRPRRTSATGSSPPASRASSTSRPSCCRCPRASTCARSTSRSSCRSCRSTSTARRARAGRGQRAVPA